MTSAVLIDDRLTQVELEMERPPVGRGFYLVAMPKFIDVRQADKPPTADEIRKLIGRYMLESAPLRSMPGVVYWCYEEHRMWAPCVRLLYAEHGHLFIQDEVGAMDDHAALVITRLDRAGRIRLLSQKDVEATLQFIKTMG